MSNDLSFFERNYAAVHYPVQSPVQAGLRSAQLGAIHAIASHFTVSNNPALIVMPTGSGKTEVLMLSPFVLRAKRVLVITPSRIVCDQIEEKFQDFGLLKNIDALVNLRGNLRILNLDSMIKDQEGWNALAENDLVISTPICVSPARESVPNPEDANLFDLVLVDEAHHEPASSIRAILGTFRNARHVLFTATPYRLDRRSLDAEIIFNYPMIQAYEDKIFGRLRFVPVTFAHPDEKDIRIAQEAAKVFNRDRDHGYQHYIMVKTNSQEHAKQLAVLYHEHTSLKLSLVYSSQSRSKNKENLDQLASGNIDGIICVDMLGEGFDFPGLKIAALHNPPKSLPATLQFIGRFARTVRATGKLGEATFLGATDIRGEVEKLYSSEGVWNDIIDDLDQMRVNAELQHRIAHRSLLRVSETESDIADLSFYALKPTLHAKIFRVSDNALIRFDRLSSLAGLEMVRGFSVGDEIQASAFITRERSTPPWTSSVALARIEYHLFVIYYDEDTHLLFLSSSRRSEAIYQQIASQIIYRGSFTPLPIREMNQVLLGFEYLEFFNIGMRNRILSSQKESYRLISGSAAHRAVSRVDGRSYFRGHVFGRGQKDGERYTIGYSSSSKVWSNTTPTVPGIAAWIEWCKEIAQRIASEREAKTNSNLDHLSLGRQITEFPDDVVAAVWHEYVYEHKVRIDHGKLSEELLDIDLIIESLSKTKIILRLKGESINTVVAYSPAFPWFSTRGKYGIVAGHEFSTLADFLNRYPIKFYTARQAALVGSTIFSADQHFNPYAANGVEVEDWEAAEVNIHDEVTGSNSIHGFLKGKLPDLSDIVFYDHRTGEIADFVTFGLADQQLTVSLYHVKATKGEKPSDRFADLHEVCGQVFKSVYWLNWDKLLERIDDRSRSGSIFIKGDYHGMRKLVASKLHPAIVFEMVIVQPGISKQGIAENEKLSEILAATEQYVLEAGCNKLRVIGSP